MRLPLIIPVNRSYKLSQPDLYQYAYDICTQSIPSQRLATMTSDQIPRLSVERHLSEEKTNNSSKVSGRPLDHFHPSIEIDDGRNPINDSRSANSPLGRQRYYESHPPARDSHSSEQHQSTTTSENVATHESTSVRMIRSQKPSPDSVVENESLARDISRDSKPTAHQDNGGEYRYSTRAVRHVSPRPSISDKPDHSSFQHLSVAGSSQLPSNPPPGHASVHGTNSSLAIAHPSPLPSSLAESERSTPSNDTAITNIGRSADHPSRGESQDTVDHHDAPEAHLHGHLAPIPLRESSINHERDYSHVPGLDRSAAGQPSEPGPPQPLHRIEAGQVHHASQPVNPRRMRLRICTALRNFAENIIVWVGKCFGGQWYIRQRSRDRPMTSVAVIISLGVVALIVYGAIHFGQTTVAGSRGRHEVQ